MSGITPKKRKMRRIGDPKPNKAPKSPKHKIDRLNERKTVSYTYQIVLVNHGKLVKSFKKLKNRSTILDIYHKELNESTKVIFPKKHNVLDELIQCNYELLFIKEIKDDETISVEPDRVYIDYKFKKWKIVKREPYQIEETFRLFGFDDKTERKNVEEIKDYLLTKDTYNREFGIIGNKIIIFNEDEFDMIITKCPQDAKDFGRFLYTYIDKPKLFFYRGIYQGGDKPEIIDIIENFTNWSRTKINRIKKG